MLLFRIGTIYLYDVGMEPYADHRPAFLKEKIKNELNFLISLYRHRATEDLYLDVGAEFYKRLYPTIVSESPTVKIIQVSLDLRDLDSQMKQKLNNFFDSFLQIMHYRF